MKYKLELNDIQASMISRMLKEEIVKQRKWKKEEKNKTSTRDYLSANMWELIEQLCKQNPTLEYWDPECTHRTDEEEEELKNVK